MFFVSPAVRLRRIGIFYCVLLGLFSWLPAQIFAQATDQKKFPYVLPDEKPDMPLSAAMERLYSQWPKPRPEQNELYTQFKYTRLKGFDYHGHDGTVSRRDPSKIILVNGKYYVWYTKRSTSMPPQHAHNATETVPSTDWDLSEIWYATSTDGFEWEEQGVAIPRPPKPNVGWRSVTTTDILIWKGKYYLYYQGFTVPSGTKGDDCPVAMSWADSPDGPWTALNKVVIPNGAEGEWDHYSVHDPYPLVHDGKVYLYYKSDTTGGPYIRMHGLAIADNPLGPFKKHPLNPVMSSGHETTLFPFGKGVATLSGRDGVEHHTIQYAEDWVNFEIMSITDLTPLAAGPYVPDAFTDTADGRGITWGLAHIYNVASDWSKDHSMLVRFDCDLSRDVNDPEMKGHFEWQEPDIYFRRGLSTKQLQQRSEAARRRSKQTPEATSE